MRTFAKPSSGGVVLLYHRIAEVATDPQLLAVTPEHFAEHLEVINNQATPMRLRDMQSAASEKNLPDRAVAITFDDGYADNFQNAAPLLHRNDIPAVVFATTAHTDTMLEFFWDELDRLLLQPNTLPSELLLDVEGCVRRFDTSGCAKYHHANWELNRRWNVQQPAMAGSRQHLYLQLCSLLHPLTSHEREECVRELQSWVGCGAIGRDANRMMGSAELLEISGNGLIEIGAHTATHPLLAIESEQKQIDEIRSSRESLQTFTGQPVTSFSYPFGTRQDYSPTTSTAVAAAGFELACSNFHGKVHSDTDRYQIPRLIVRDWDGPEFARRLQKWFQMPCRPLIAA